MFSALFLDKEEKSSFYRQYFPFYDFFQKVLVQNLVVPWDFVWKSIFHSINDIIYLSFNIRHWLRGRVISQNFMYHQNSPHFVQKRCNNTLCDGYVSKWEIFKEFSLKLQIFVNSSNLTHNNLPHRLRGSKKKVPFIKKY